MKLKNFKKLKPGDKVVVKESFYGHQFPEGSIIEFVSFSGIGANFTDGTDPIQWTLENDEVRRIKKTDKVKLDEALLKQAIDCLDEYLNAGSKEDRRKASEKAKEVYEKYYGTPYQNKNEK